MKLSRQSVVVVGGSLGIGYAVAELAKRQGAEVTLLARNAERLRRAAESLGGVRHAVADFGNEAAVNRAFAELPAVHHVYVAAGTAMPGGFLDRSVDDAMASFVERVWGSAYVLRAAAPKIPPGGSVTLTGGVSTDRPFPGAWSTVLGTATAEQLARVMALELAPIRVNAVSPGYTDTPMWDRLLGGDRDAVLAGVAAKLPTGRIATPEEVAEAVLLLMTNGSITGEVIHVDGGGRLV
jgi:NAD(P)-dependent dehydrogenase (short-subunit alcohol dehydrogenase family)